MKAELYSAIAFSAVTMGFAIASELSKELPGSFWVVLAGFLGVLGLNCMLIFSGFV